MEDYLEHEYEQKGAIRGDMRHESRFLVRSPFLRYDLLPLTQCVAPGRYHSLKFTP